MLSIIIRFICPDKIKQHKTAIWYQIDLKAQINMYLSVEGHLVACLRAADCHDVTISSSFVIVSLFLGTMFPSPFWSPVTLTGNRNSHIHILNNRYSSSIGECLKKFESINSPTQETLIPGTWWLWWMKAWLQSNMCTQIFSVPLLRIIFIFPLISTNTTQHWL